MILHHFLSLLIFSITSAKADIRIVQTGDYVVDDTVTTSSGHISSFAEPYKMTTLTTDLDLDETDKIEWSIKFLPRDDEVWSDLERKLVDMEVFGHTMVGHTVEYMFKLPGMYEVAVKKQKKRKRLLKSADKSNDKKPKDKKGKKNEPKNGTNKKGKKNKPKNGTNKKDKKNKPKNGKNKKDKKSKKGKDKVLATSEIRVAYARRDVIDMSAGDWDKYVDAIWTLKNLSTAEGQARYGPNFYNIDVFTTMHGVHSQNASCDQIHFNLMQENAHHVWMTLLEKALQSVHPSIAMPYYNFAKDFRKYYNPDIGIKSVLNSPIFGDDYYGGGLSNWDERPDPYDPYYVADGRFANFPIRQNRTELCDESQGLFDDDMYIPFCKEVMEEGGFKGFRNDDPTSSGMWIHEPRDESSYKYVSARRMYVYGSVGDTTLPLMVPRHEQINVLESVESPVDQLLQIGRRAIHGFGHIGMSGMWGGGVTNETMIPPTAQANPGKPLLEVLANDDKLLTNFAWGDEIISKKLGCYQCTKEGCTLNMAVAVEKNCYNINNGFGVPVDFKQPKWTDAAERGNAWYDHLEMFNIGQWMRFALYGFGIQHSNSGTFARHAWANQDPLFYAYHAFTFITFDDALQSLEKRGIASAPFYGIKEFIDERGVNECPGNNPDDELVFKNVVRYKTGQTPGSHHTWKDILEMWSPERRDFEWVMDDEDWTNFDERIRFDDSCEEACTDDAQVIKFSFPGWTTTEVCEFFINSITSSGATKEQACATRLKDIPSVGLPWIPDRFVFFSHVCRKTCGYCTNVCGEKEGS